MNLSHFVSGLQILGPYYDDPHGYHLGAEHDTIYIYATDVPLRPEDVTALNALGFFQPDVMPENDMGKREYDPEEGWAAYV